MEISCSTNGNIGFVVLMGQLWQTDDLNAVEETIDNLIKQKIIKVVLDIDRLGFINSAGLGLLARVHTRLQDAGGKVILFNPHSSILEVIEISGFNMFMTIVKSKDELKAELGQ